MSLNKAIEHGKEHRKSYGTTNKAYSKQCRNHGDCPVCGGNRLYQRHKAEEAAEHDLNEYNEDDDWGEADEKDWLFDADPNCDHHIVDAPGGGIKCTKCRGWFCF